MATTINASTSAGLVSTADTSGVLQLQAAGTTVLNAELGKALALQGATSTTGCGIAFPATQVQSSNANTLDDYEEGTWTPIVTFGGASVGVTYSSQAGNYTKIGNTVRLGITIDLSSKGSSTGRLAITGSPFPFATSQSGLPVSLYCDKVTVTGTIQPYLYSDNNIYFLYLSSGTATNVTNAEVVNTSSLYVTVIYPTTA
jgi:hypothetical protein